MSAPDWTAIATRFHAAAAKLRPSSSGMVPCPQCGAPNPPHAPACSFCGFRPHRPAKLQAPNWWRRVGAVANRLTPRICPKCGGDGLHRLPCERAHRSIDPRIQFGNAVIRAERKLAARRALHEMLHDLGQATVVGMGRCERCAS